MLSIRRKSIKAGLHHGMSWVSARHSLSFDPIVRGATARSASRDMLADDFHTKLVFVGSQRKSVATRDRVCMPCAISCYFSLALRCQLLGYVSYYELIHLLLLHPISLLLSFIPLPSNLRRGSVLDECSKFQTETCE